jgi:hypothetical protein
MSKGVWIRISVLGTLVAGLAYAWLIEPARVEVTHHRVQSSAKGEPRIRLVQLSDLHLQSIGRREQAVAHEVQALKPDLLVLSGDVIDDAAKLSVLEAFLPLLGSGEKVAVLGNWEHWSDLDVDELRALYARHRVRLLVNERAAYRFGDRTVQVTGLDDFTGGRPQVNTAESSQPGSVRLLIQHSPGWFRMPEATAINRRFDLCLAGHTHGGQIALFGLPVWTPRGSGDFVAGRYDLAMCPLYVSRGIGTSIVPVRFGARPEIAVFEL